MSNDDLVDIVYKLLIEKHQDFKELENVASISSYYDNENIEHIKVDLGYQTYIISVE